MNKLKPSNENFIALESCILNNKTLKEAFNEFSQGDYTFSQVKRFYYKYKEELEEADKNIIYCENCIPFTLDYDIEMRIVKRTSLRIKRLL